MGDLASAVAFGRDTSGYNFFAGEGHGSLEHLMKHTNTHTDKHAYFFFFYIPH